MFKQFIAFLLDDYGRSYYRKDTGEADTISTPTPIPDMYEGWDEMQAAYERDLKYFSLKRSFTLPIKLLFAFKWMVRWIILKKSTEEKVYLLIQKLKASVSGSSYDVYYDYWYKGQVDLTSFNYGDDRDSVSLIEGGIKKLVEQNTDVTQAISVDDDPKRVVLKYEGIELDQSATYYLPAMALLRYHFVPVAFENKEGTGAGAGFFDSFGREVPASYDYITNNKGSDYFFVTTLAIKGIEIKGTVNFVAGGNRSKYEIFLYRTSVGNVLIQTINNLHQGQAYSIPINLTIDSVAGEKFYLTAHVSEEFPALPVLYQEGSLSVTLKSRFTPSFINTLPISVFATRVLQKCGVSETDIDVSWLTAFDNYLLYSGDNLRGLSGGKIQTTLTDVRDFVRLICAGGSGVENDKFLFREYEHFWDTTSPVYLGEAASCKASPANEFKGNRMKVGYPKQQIDDVNGKSSFHNTYVRTIPCSVDKELNFVCNYIPCPYDQENYRINLEGKSTTDDSSDTGVFVGNAERRVFSVDTAIAYGGGQQGFFISGAVASDMLAMLFQGATFTVSSSLNTVTFTANSFQLVNGNLEILTLEPTINEILTAPSFSFNNAAELKRIAYDQVVGIPEPGFIFNVEGLTQMRMLETQRRFLNSCFSDLAGKKILFVSTDKNADFETTKNGVTITEKGDFVLSSDILFQAWYLEIEIRVSEDTVAIMDARPNQCFSFDWYGDRYTGFAIKVVASANDSRMQKIKLLATPDCDLTKLIKPLYG